ncbi:MAG TPA: hypothetical protein VGF56_07080 [Rhizomicrobium sp.]|jgi:hypothetical protein
MQKFLIALFALLSLAAVAAPLSDKDKAALAGEWRSDCAAPHAPGFTLEFAVTGGEIFIADPGRGRLMLSVKTTDADGAALTLGFLTEGGWSFRRDGANLLSLDPPKEFPALKGLSFAHCRPAASRAALKLGPDAIDFLSVMMPPDYPTFIDAHEKEGCRAKAYAYLSVDLVGPLQFALTKGSLKPGATGGPPVLADSITWSINAAEELPNVVRLTLTPLSGPGKARGAPAKISLVVGVESNLLTIPEWDAVYRRCTIRELVGG